MMNALRIVAPRRVLASAVIGTVLALGAGCSSTPSRETTGQYFHDAAITSKIKARILEDQTLQGFQIKVDTYRGHVILSGFVNRARQIREAMHIARTTPGVVSVRNDLVVKNTTSGGAGAPASSSPGYGS
ncbi:BON domain-containing protein [Acidiferrobacter sp.]|jgi:osmotically-inducible protein OsmY|uniref:BON domain-containing protein n=1 Tax=Acidiferrobacter sp. TaxID=1872107 RepID=UPI0026304AC8|nr:BON domain-containing protein [Acidiferrobacter sp.]